MSNKLPLSELKDGEFYIKGGCWAFIFDHFDRNRQDELNAIVYKAFYGIGSQYLSVPEIPSTGVGYYEDCLSLRHATNKEREEFMKVLHRNRYTYNEETKSVERI